MARSKRAGIRRVRSPRGFCLTVFGRLPAVSTASSGGHPNMRTLRPKNVDLFPGPARRGRDGSSCRRRPVPRIRDHERAHPRRDGEASSSAASSSCGMGRSPRCRRTRRLDASGRRIDAGGEDCDAQVSSTRIATSYRATRSSGLRSARPKELQAYLDAGFTTVLSAIDPPQLLEARKRGFRKASSRGRGCSPGTMISIGWPRRRRLLRPASVAAGGAPGGPPGGPRMDPARTDPARGLLPRRARTRHSA